MCDQVMPALGLLLLFQYTVLLGPPPFTGLRDAAGWLLLVLQGRFGPDDHVSEASQVRHKRRIGSYTTKPVHLPTPQSQGDGFSATVLAGCEAASTMSG